MQHEVGLHARPSVKLTKLAKTFARGSRSARRSPEGPWIDAKSIVKVMAMKAPQGTDDAIFAPRATDAQAAVAALVELVERDFDDGPSNAERPSDRAGGPPRPGLRWRRLVRLVRR